MCTREAAEGRAAPRPGALFERQRAERRAKPGVRTCRRLDRRRRAAPSSLQHCSSDSEPNDGRKPRSEDNVALREADRRRRAAPSSLKLCSSVSEPNDGRSPERGQCGSCGVRTVLQL